MIFTWGSCGEANIIQIQFQSTPSHHMMLIRVSVSTDAHLFQSTPSHHMNVVGYFAWSLLVNFEWLLGYTSMFGIVYVDFHTLERHPKASAYWFSDMLQGKH